MQTLCLLTFECIGKKTGNVSIFLELYQCFPPLNDRLSEYNVWMCCFRLVSCVKPVLLSRGAGQASKVMQCNKQAEPTAGVSFPPLQLSHLSGGIKTTDFETVSVK